MLGMLDWLRTVFAPIYAQTTGADELAPGIPKPSSTLVHMLVSEMFCNLDATWSHTSSDCVSVHSRYHHYTAKFPSFTLHTMCSSYGKYSVKEVKLKSQNQPFYFDPDEREILLSGLTKWLKMREAARQTETETIRQNTALDAISKLLGVDKNESGDGSDVTELTVSSS